MLKDSFFYFVSKLLPGFINLLTVYIFTRMLTTAEYGSYSLILTIATFIYAIFFEWLRITYLRFYNTFEDYKARYSSTVLFIITLIILLMVILGVNIGFIKSFIGLNNVSESMIIIIIFLVISLTAFDLSKTIARANLKPGLFGVINSLKSILSLSLAALLYMFGFGMTGLFIGILLGTVLPSLPLLWKEFKNSKLLIDKKIYLTIIRHGLPLILTLVMAVGLYSIDRIMLATYTNLEVVGIYSASYNLGQQSIFFLMTVVNLASFPIVINAMEKRGNEAASKELENNFVYLMGVSIPAIFGLISLSENIVGVILDKDYYNASVSLFPLISIGVFFQGLKLYYFDLPFHLASKTKSQRIPVIFALCLNFILNLFFIPKYGAIGAAFTTIIAYLVSMVLSLIIGRNYFKLPFKYDQFIKILIASTVMYCMLLLVNQYQGITMLIVQIIFGTSIYLILAFIMNIGDSRKKVLGWMSDGKN